MNEKREAKLLKEVAPHDAKVLERVAPHLTPDESMISWVAAEQAGRNKGGHLLEMVARAGISVFKNKKAKQEAEVAGFPFATKTVLVATSSRLLVFAQSTGSRVWDIGDQALPGELLGEVAYDRIYAAQGKSRRTISSGMIDEAGWVAFRLMDGQTYVLGSWSTTAEKFGIELDQVLAAATSPHIHGPS